ncbi:MAG: DUF1800 family protein [Verrucomicrobiales bacterium]|nr:DUF1800 family protein [Verrucomicrobiales bacterium]
MKATAQKLNIKLRPLNAWMRIEPAHWTEASVRHLLRRATWTARPVDVRELMKVGPAGMMDYLFGRAAYPNPHPVIEDFVSKIDAGLTGEFAAAMEWGRTDASSKQHVAKIRKQSYRDPHMRRVILEHDEYQRAKAREEGDEKMGFVQFRNRFDQGGAWNRYAHEWLRIASVPRNSAFSKFNLFLQNVLVVNQRSLEGSNDYMADVHNFHRVIRDHCFGSYPVLVKKMFKTAAMGRMLDLLGSTKGSPNENFAREVMELFTLGVSRGYDEDDIKEAAKAFTGYVIDPESNPYTLGSDRDELILDPTKHDDSRKRVLGRTADHDGDSVVDTIFTKPDAEVHLLRHLTHEYLIEGGLSDDYLRPLGAEWRRRDFNLRWLLETFLLSRIFHDPFFHGQIYKCPFQFYLGLLQDLGLQVEPGAEIVREMDFLGQRFSDPPDVNGWDGGAFWMNNGTINARRIIVARLFSGSDRAGGGAASSGAASFRVTDELLGQFIDEKPRTDAELVGHFLTYLMAIEPGPAFTGPLEQHLAKATNKAGKIKALRQAILAILQSQYYQVC